MNRDPSLKDWIITLIFLCIPIVNIVMLILWINSENPNDYYRKNFSRAMLTVYGGLFAIGIIMVLIGTVFESNSTNEPEPDFLTPYFNAIENQQEYNADEMFVVNALQVNGGVLDGSVKNISQDTFSSVTLTINIYDNQNALIGTAYPTVHGVIRPEESFALNFYLPEISSIEGYNAEKAKFAEIIEYSWYFY